jgi:hypothetical protein
MAPCGFASGISGALPHAAFCGTPSIRRNRTAQAPIIATMRAKMLEKFMKFPCWSRSLYLTLD